MPLCRLPPVCAVDSSSEADSRSLELPEAIMAQLQEEARTMSHLRHPNVSRIMGLVVIPPALITGAWWAGAAGCG